MSGPLSGVKVLEFAGLGPAPFCGMLLADLGADVVRIDRRGAAGAPSIAEGMRVLGRGRRSIELDLKAAADVETALALAGKADALIEGFRPGVMERLGLGPDAVLARNPKIAYGRMTGWGQDGPLARTAGHDIDYIALTGALHAIGLEDKPVAPLNLIGDFGGGGAYLAFGVVSAMLHAQRTGEGQVVDCAMTDGAASLMAMIYGMHGEGLWSDQRRTNFVDGGTPYYDTYQCADGGWVAVGGAGAAVLRPAAQTDRPGRRSCLFGPDQPRAMAGHARGADPRVPQQDPRRVVRSVRGGRRLPRPRADPGGGAPSPAQPGAADLRGVRRPDPARPRAPLLPHARRHPPPRA